MLDQQYKFYLAFENALCIDYVTEKFFNALRRQIVPVVFGGANYTRFAPPHSYIDAESFASVADLARYLQHLDANPTEYLRYFWWRKYYQVRGGQPYCDLCEKLHSTKYRNKMQTYRNIEEWWISGSCRFQSKIKW